MRYDHEQELDNLVRCVYEDCADRADVLDVVRAALDAVDECRAVTESLRARVLQGQERKG